jgi:hypothetical protein
MSIRKIFGVTLLAALAIAALAAIAGQALGQAYGMLTVALLSCLWVPFFVYWSRTWR